MCVFEKVKEVLIKCGFDEKDILPKISLVNDLAVDSTEMVEIMVALEKKFECKIKGTIQCANVNNVEELSSHIAMLLKEKTCQEQVTQ